MEFSVIHKILENCSLYKDNTAFYIEGKGYTYQELKQNILRIAALIRKNAAKDSVIGIFHNNDLESYAALYACWFLGKAYLPFNHLNPPARNKEIIKAAGIITIMSSTLVEGESGYLTIGTKILDIKLQHEGLDDDDLHNPEEHDLAYILFTSGSTGIPKGVPIHFAALDSFMESFIRDYQIDATDRFLQIYDISFDGAIPCYVAPLCFGASIYTVPQDGIKYLNAFKLIRDKELTVIKMTPSVLNMLQPYFSQMRFEKVKYTIFGGEALYDRLAGEWTACVPNAILQNVYGPSEATVFCLKYEWRPGEEILCRNNIVSLGKVFGQNNIIIVDENNIPLPADKTGELCISGSQLFQAYLSDRKNKRLNYFIKTGKSSEKFYKTGDLAEMDKNRNYFYNNRKDNQIQIQGFRVELGEVELCARNYFRDGLIAVIPIKDNRDLIHIHLCVQIESVDKQDVMLNFGKYLPAYMIPEYIHCIKRFPLTSVGKIDYSHLKKMIIDGNKS